MAARRRTNRRRKIALAFGPGAPYQEQITVGISRYALEHRWDLVTSPEGGALSLENLSGWKGDGVVAMLDTKAAVAEAATFPLPLVNIAASLRTPDVPTVTSNQRAIGEAAAEVLIRRNFRRFAFYGVKGVWYSEERKAGFRKRIEAAGYNCETREAESSLLSTRPWRSDREALSAWLENLVFPTGIFAVHDYRARIVSECCADSGIRIPVDLALIGVDDDPLVCAFSSPSLTSVRQDGETVGRVAAQSLAAMMKGSGRTADCWIDPLGVVERASTETLAVENPLLRRWLGLVDLHHRDPVDASWLAAKLGVSRRRIELLSREELSRSPHEVLRAARVESAKTLLLSDEPPSLGEVAIRSGLRDARGLRAAFERVEGVSPRDFVRGVDG